MGDLLFLLSAFSLAEKKSVTTNMFIMLCWSLAPAGSIVIEDYNRRLLEPANLLQWMKRARCGRGRETFLDSIVNLSKDKKCWLQRQYCATNDDFHSRLLYRARSDCATVIIRSMSPYICFVRVVKAVKVSLCESQVLRHIIALRNIVSNL